MAEGKTHNSKSWEINWNEFTSRVKNKNERQRDRKQALRRKDERNYSRGHAGKVWDHCSAMYQW